MKHYLYRYPATQWFVYLYTLGFKPMYIIILSRYRCYVFVQYIQQYIRDCVKMSNLGGQGSIPCNSPTKQWTLISSWPRFICKKGVLDLERDIRLPCVLGNEIIIQCSGHNSRYRVKMSTIWVQWLGQ